MKQRILNFRNPNNLRQRLVVINENNKNKRSTFDTKLAESSIFVQSSLYLEIHKKTNFLDIYDIEIPNWFRLKCIFKDVYQIQLCPICGKPCKLNLSKKANDPIFRVTCGDQICMAKYSATYIKPQSQYTKKLHANSMKNRRKILKEKYCNLFKTFKKDKNEKLSHALNEIQQYCLNAKNNQFKNGLLIREKAYFEHETFLLDILKMTKFIPIEIQNASTISVKDFNWHERIYCVLNGIASRPKCCYCQIEHVKFSNSDWQYAKSCAKCKSDKLRECRGLLTINDIKNNIDSLKYEIIAFPKNNLAKNPLKIKCKKCGYISEIFLVNGKMHNIQKMLLCKKCEKYVSNAENEIRNFIASISNEQLIVNTRDLIAPMEIDIYIPSKKLAIEFDGFYWHNDTIVKNNYHLVKTNLCEKQGIQLVHIFENEWLFKSDIVKSRLKNLLSIYDKTVFARKCKIKEVDSNTSREFQEENHIQGSVNAKVKLGLFYENELVSLMTFGKCRFSKKYEWELLRFCNKLGYHIPGAAGKLLKYFEKNYKPKSLVSYADRRWSQGKLYDALGFTLINKSSPNYWYYKSSMPGKIHSRVSFQKHKLKTILDIYNENLSEKENMKANGFSRIFDCGNLVFEKKY